MAATIVTGFLNGMQDQLQRLVARHEKFLSGQLRKDSALPERTTGNNICKMTAELEISKSPYPSSKERILEDVSKIQGQFCSLLEATEMIWRKEEQVLKRQRVAKESEG